MSLIQLYFPFDIICNLAVLVPNMAIFVLLNDFNCPKITVTVYQIWVYLSYIKLYVCLMLLYLSLTWLCFVPNMTVFVLICLHLSTIWMYLFLIWLSPIKDYKCHLSIASPGITAYKRVSEQVSQAVRKKVNWFLILLFDFTPCVLSILIKSIRKRVCCLENLLP